MFSHRARKQTTCRTYYLLYVTVESNFVLSTITLLHLYSLPCAISRRLAACLFFFLALHRAAQRFQRHAVFFQFFPSSATRFTRLPAAFSVSWRFADPRYTCFTRLLPEISELCTLLSLFTWHQHNNTAPYSDFSRII